MTTNPYDEGYEDLQDQLDKCKAINEKLVMALNVILDQVDYSNNNCRVNEMVGAVLSIQVITLARTALAKDKEQTS